MSITLQQSKGVPTRHGKRLSASDYADLIGESAQSEVHNAPEVVIVLGRMLASIDLSDFLEDSEDDSKDEG